MHVRRCDAASKWKAAFVVAIALTSLCKSSISVDQSRHLSAQKFEPPSRQSSVLASSMPDSWSHRQASHRQPAEVQSASKYKPISRPSVPLNGYPADSPAFVASLHDLRYYQGVLSDPGNFSTETSCDIFEVQDQQARWIPSKEYQTDAYFEVLAYVHGVSGRY